MKWRFYNCLLRFLQCTNDIKESCRIVFTKTRHPDDNHNCSNLAAQYIAVWSSITSSEISTVEAAQLSSLLPGVATLTTITVQSTSDIRDSDIRDFRL